METSYAIAEIAGRDSVAAAIAAVREHGFTTIQPTIGFTGTETGDAAAPLRAIDSLRGLLGDGVEVLEPVELADHELWAALNATYQIVLQRRFGICSPCMACHLYLHLLRVPLALERGGAPVIAGERDTHDGRIKLSQTSLSIDAATRVLEYAGVRLLEPVRHADGAAVAALVGESWEEGGAQLGCLLSGNYKDLDGRTVHDEEAYERYVREFFEPAGYAIVDAMMAAERGERPNYGALVREVLTTPSC